MIEWLFIGAAGVVSYGIYRHRTVNRRAELIENYEFPDTIARKIMARYPHLDETETAQILQGLREYFQVCNVAGRRMVSMPSQAVDVAWHEFILFTRKYQKFCDQALGRFLHHTPAEAMAAPTQAQTGIKRAWRIACAREKINPKQPERLPLLFGLDVELNIADGFRYTLNCNPSGADGFCAGDISCSSGCAGDSGGDGCGGGCGGD